MAIQTRILEGNIHIGGDGPTSSVNIGGSATEKIGFHGKKPVAQSSGAGQADQGTMTTIGANTGTSTAGLTLIGATDTINQAANIMADFAALQEDIAAQDVLLTEIRTALVTCGIIKGAA